VDLDCDETTSEQRCCRYPLTVDFAEFGWDWVLAPTRFEAYYCAGLCPFVYQQVLRHCIHFFSVRGQSGLEDTILASASNIWPRPGLDLDLRSAAGHQLVVPSYRLNSCGLRAFSVLGPRLWKSLPRLLRDTSHRTASFGHSLKTFFLSEYQCIRGFGDYALYISTFYLLTYLLVVLLCNRAFFGQKSCKIREFC